MKLTLAKKMYGVVGLMMAVILGISTASYFVSSSIIRGYDNVIEKDINQSDISMEALVELGNAIHSFKNYVLRRDEKYVAEFRKSIETIKKSIKEYEKFSTTKEEKDLVIKAEEALVSYEKSIDKLIEAAKEINDIQALDKAVKGADRPLEEALKNMDKVAMKNAEAAKNTLRKNAKIAVITMIIIAIMVLIFSAFFSFIITNRVLKSVKEVAEVVRKISAGDLKNDVTITSNDEIGDMAKDFNDMMANLRKVLSQITTTAGTLAASSEELSQATNALSEGAKEQARQTEQAATAITQVAQTVTDVAQNASATSNLSKEASKIAFEGKQKVESAVDAMNHIATTVRETSGTINELGKSSQEIGNIVRIINDIADQTNLLSLNAAIEAARAGEQGRGFAVVADEVRKLAERTSKATCEIGAMIKRIQEETESSVQSMESGIVEVEKGVRLAEEAYAAMERIVNAANNSNDMIQRIAVAAEEQSAASEQVSANMESIANVIRNTEVATAQIKSSAEDLARIGTELKNIVAWFKI